MTTPADDAFTELVDADIPRVDLVDRAANGLPFLLAKSEDGAAGGLVSPDLVRGLIGKTEPQPANDPEQVTMSGSPAAIAKLIHQAAVRQAEDDVAKGGTVVEEPTRPESDLDPTTVLAAPDGGSAPGSPVEPGSPAWEAIDAATARKWTAILARAKHALTVLSEREELEAVTGDMVDAFHTMELTDAADAVDYAISILAPFAVGEQAEADCHADMAAVGKALADFDAEPLDTIEAMAHVTKAGRILSARNETAIRTAVESLQKVLASLPTAPELDSPEAGLPVTKEETVMPEPTEETPAVDAPDTVGKADEESADASADKTPQLAVYDHAGKLIGIVDPDNLVPVVDDGSDEAPDVVEDAVGDAPTGVVDVIDSADTPMDLAPAPGAEVGTPADEVGKTTTEDAPAAEPDDITKTTDDDTPAGQADDVIKTDTTADDVLKSSIADVVKAILDEHSAAQEQVIAKQAADLAQLTELVETLKGQIHTLEEQPATPAVFTNGAVPPAHQMRGQDHGAPAVDTARARELKKGLYGAADATEQNRIAQDMQAGAIQALQAIHQRQPSTRV